MQYLLLNARKARPKGKARHGKVRQGKARRRSHARSAAAFINGITAPSSLSHASVGGHGHYNCIGMRDCACMGGPVPALQLYCW